jgi:hypothetical protein
MENVSHVEGQRVSDRPQPGLWVGVGLVMIGALMFLDQMGIHLFFRFNWWALFLFLPAGAILRNVNDAYQVGGHTLNRTMRTQLIVGIVLMVLAFLCLLGVSAAVFWPLTLIAAGVVAITSRV